MNTLRTETAASLPDIDWVPFPGGELEGVAAKVCCPACKIAVRQAAGVSHKPALCFQCFRLGVERNRKLKAAGELDTASEARFQTSLPFAPVDHARLTRLKHERQEARVAAGVGSGGFIVKRRRAQIEARHALAMIVQGLKQRRLAEGGRPAHTSRVNVPRPAANVQLPESWLPFVAAQ